MSQHAPFALIGLALLMSGCSRPDWLGRDPDHHISPQFNIAFMKGQRKIDAGLGPAAGEHEIIGAMISVGLPRLPFAIEVGTNVSRGVETTSNGTEFALSVADWFVGARTYWRSRRWPAEAFVAADVSFVRSMMRVDDGLTRTVDVDLSYGLTLHAGAIWKTSRGLFIGADARKSIGPDANLFGATGDLDDVQFMLLVGMSQALFPADASHQ